MVMTSACLPLTARLSIGMSFSGLRPMVRRSFPRSYSPWTTPFKLSTSFAIDMPYPLTSGKPSEQTCQRTPGIEKLLRYPDQDNGDVVFAPFGVRLADQFLGRLYKISTIFT